MNKTRKEGSISSYKTVYRNVFCSAQAEAKVTQALLSGKKILVGELASRHKKYLVAHQIEDVALETSQDPYKHIKCKPIQDMPATHQNHSRMAS